MIASQEKATQLNMANTGEFKVSCWKTTFLDKINIPLLCVRVESCENDEGMTLWEVVLSLKGYILDHDTPGNRKKRTLDKTKGTGESPETLGPAPKKANPMIASFMRNLKQTNDPDFIKKVTGLMNEDPGKEKPKTKIGKIVSSATIRPKVAWITTQPVRIWMKTSRNSSTN